MTPTPDDNRILALFFEHFAILSETMGSRDNAAKVRQYAKRFQPEPEKRFRPAGTSTSGLVDSETGKDIWFQSGEHRNHALDLLNSLNDAAKGGKTPA